MFSRRSTATFVCGLAVASVALAGCSSSSSTSATSASPTPSTTGSPLPTFTGQNADFCNSLVAVAQAGQNAQAAAADGNTQVAASATQSLVSALGQMVQSLPADAPEQLKSGLSSLLEQAKARLANPSASPTGAAAAQKTGQELEAYASKACPEPSPSTS